LANAGIVYTDLQSALNPWVSLNFAHVDAPFDIVIILIMACKTDNKRFLQLNPQVRKWLNRCILCGAVGYKPHMPARIGRGMGAYNVRRRFRQLSVNRQGICSECASIAVSAK
jgi:hypothetical protein